MKFFLIKKLYLKNHNNNNDKNDKIGGNVPIANDINKSFSNLDINGGSIIFRNKYKNNKIKLNI